MQLGLVVSARQAAPSLFVHEALGMTIPDLPLPPSAEGQLSSLRCFYTVLAVMGLRA